MSKIKRSLLAVFFVFMFSVPAFAQHFRVVGSWSFLSIHKNIEGPFWSKGLSDRTNGDMTAEVVSTLGQLNINGVSLLRQMDLGIFDVAHTLTNYITPDCPELAGLDMPALLDTGSVFSLGLPMTYRKQLSIAAEESHGSKIIFGGRMLHISSKLNGDLIIGFRTISNSNVNFSDRENLNANIGFEILKDFRVIGFDYINNQIYLGLKDETHTVNN